MADSKLTKRALASALREFMKKEPFDKIQVTHICRQCKMNRKSFYYHFKDKYDLLNWIFDTETSSFFRDFSGPESLEQHVKLILDICNYFYENREFYYNAFKIQGQNSFSEHFWEYIRSFIKLRLVYLIGDEANDEFALDFFTDAIACAIERWMSKKDCMQPDELVPRLVNIVLRSANAVHQELKQSE